MTTPLAPISTAPTLAQCVLAASLQRSEPVRVARHLDEVLAAWNLVYRVYRHAGLIPINPAEVHTTTQAINPASAVFFSGDSRRAAATLTAIPDTADGLPLDRVYRAQLDAFRDAGHHLLEVGLFADHRQLPHHDTARHDHPATQHIPLDLRGANRLLHSGPQALATTINLMRFAFAYGRHRGVTDFVIGVHPRHARFYARAFGFLHAGPELVYPSVNHRPVVLLRANIQRNLAIRPMPYALHYAVECPVGPEVFSQRFVMPLSHDGGLDDNPILRFLRHQAQEELAAA